MTPAIDAVRALVIEVAREELAPRFTRATVAAKADGSLVTEADTALQGRLAERLQAHWPAIALLGEEMPAPEQERLLTDTRGGVWLLDPLDGTTNFAMGIPYFAVSLALLVGDAVALAVIYDPMRDECFSAEAGSGAWLNGDPLRDRAPAVPLKQGVGAVDFKRLTPQLACRVASAPPFASQRNLGSAALDWCTIAAGRYHVYLHGRQKLWDYAAGQLILAEAGGCSATLEGESVLVPRLEGRSVVAGATPALFDTWRNWLAATGR